MVAAMGGIGQVHCVRKVGGIRKVRSLKAGGALAGAGRAATLGALLASVSAVAMSETAFARVEITPRAELRHTISDSEYGDFNMITAVAPGVSILADTRRVKAQVDYEFSRRFSWDDTLIDKGQHRLNANGTAELIRRLLSVQAGAVVTQTFRDWRGPLSAGPEQNNPNQATVGSYYVQPTLTRELGNFAVFDAFYRFSYSDVDNAGRSLQIGEEAPPGFNFSLMPASDSTMHDAMASLSNRNSSSSRLIWTARGTYRADDREDLDEELRMYTGVFDVSYSLNRKVALLGSVGYEDIFDEQDNILVDPDTGLPVLDSEGRLQVDPTEPRRAVIDRKGEIWDVGVRLTPSRRTQLTLRGGRQYGGTVINGDLQYEIREGITLTAKYSETLNSFGRLFTAELGGQPFAFMVDNNYRLGPGIITIPTEFGLLPLPGTVTNATFRSRLGQASLSYSAGRTKATFAGYYDRRNYLNTGQVAGEDRPSTGILSGRSDVTWGLTLGMSRDLGGGRSVNGNVYYSNLKYALSRERRDSVYGGSVGYDWRLSDRIRASATFYTLNRSVDGFGSSQQDNSLTLSVRASF